MHLTADVYTDAADLALDAIRRPDVLDEFEWKVAAELKFATPCEATTGARRVLVDMLGGES